MIVLLAALLCGLTACAVRQHTEIRSKHPDRVLFEAALSAVKHDRFDVAHLTFQTLVNTYPNSSYAAQAKLLLKDPRIANCPVWSVGAPCQ